MKRDNDLLVFLKSISPDSLTSEGKIDLEKFASIYENEIYKSESSKNVLVQHEIQNIGKVHIGLHGFAAKLYELIKKSGVEGYLKNINHLGMISYSHPSNFHKRWDYVCTQLLLLQRLKYSSLKFLGLNSTILKINGFNISGEEYLQCQILFANIGMIPGTISTEKALMNCFLSNPNIKQNFVKAIESDWSDLINKIFANHDHYKIKYLIALDFLYKSNVDEETKKILLNFYNIDSATENGKVAKMRELFFRIRRISFIYLDTMNSHFFSTIQMGKILFNVSNYDSLFNPNSNDWLPLFETWEDTLMKMLYNSPLAIKQDIYNYYDVVGKLESQKNHVFNNCLLKAIIKRPESLFPAKLYNDNPLIGQFYFTYKDVSLHKTLWSLSLKSTIINALKSEESLNYGLNKKIAGYKNRCYISFDNSRQFIFLNYLIEKSKISNSTQLKRVLLNNTQVFIKYLDIIDKGILKDKNIYHHIREITFKSMIRKYFLFILQLITKYESKKVRYNGYIDYTSLGGIKNYFCETKYFTGVDEVNKYLDEKVKIKQVKSNKDILNTIKVFRQVIAAEKIKHNSKILACFLPIKLDKIVTDFKLMNNSDTPTVSKPCTDVDLIFFSINRTKVDLYIIEGKDVQKGMRKQTDLSFERLNNIIMFNDLLKSPILVKSKGNGSYIKVTLN